MYKNNETVGLRMKGDVNRLLIQFYHNRHVRKDLDTHKKFTICNSRTLSYLQFLAFTTSTKRKINTLIATKVTYKAVYGFYKSKDMPISLRHAIKSVVPKGSKIMIKPDHDVTLSDYLIRNDKKDLIGFPPVVSISNEIPLVCSYSEGDTGQREREDFYINRQKKVCFDTTINAIFKSSEIFTGLKVGKECVIYIKPEIDMFVSSSSGRDVRIPIKRYPYVTHTHDTVLYFKVYLGNHKVVY